MNFLVVNVPLNPDHAHLVFQFLQLRTSVFVGKLSWPLDVSEGLEFEQYDIFTLAQYVLAVGDEGQVLGGARLLRCDTSTGTGTLRYSYMIRDAWRGVIDLPKEICISEPTTSPKYWEFTRFAVVSKDPKVSAGILGAALNFLKANDADGCLFLGPPAFMRVARRYGFDPVALGPVQSNSDGRFVAFKCELQPDKSSPQKATF